MPIPDNQKFNMEVKFEGLIAGAGSTSKNTFNTLHFRRTTSVNPFSKAAFDVAFQAAVGDKIVLALNHTWSQLFNTVRCINDAQDAPVFFSHINVGAVAGDRTSVEGGTRSHIDAGWGSSVGPPRCWPETILPGERLPRHVTSGGLVVGFPFRQMFTAKLKVGRR